MKNSAHLQSPSPGTAQFPNGEFASSLSGDAQRQRRSSFELESVARRAAAPEITAKHLLAGCAQNNRDCIHAVLDTPVEAFPDALQGVARAVHDLHATGAHVDVVGLYRTLDALEVQNPGVLLADLGSYASCAPDLDSRALLLDYAKRDSANKLALISEIAAGGDLEGARHAMADLSPFQFAPVAREYLPLEDIENAGAMPEALFECGIYKECLNLCIGESGSGKSMFALTLALSLSTGKTLLKGFAPRAPGRVLYLSGEDCAGVLKQRAHDIAKAHGVTTTGADWHFVTRATPLVEVDADGVLHCSPAWRELERKAHGCALLVIDPLVSWAALASENDAAGMGRLAELFKTLAAESGTGVLLAHHTNKVGASSLEQGSARGSGALPAAARFAVSLARPTENAMERLGLPPGDRARFLRVAISKNSYGGISGDARMLERVEGGALVDADPEGARIGALAEALAGALADTGAHLTRRELIQGRGDLALEVRKRLVESEGVASGRMLERAIAHGLRFGLLKEHDTATGARRARREVLPNE